MGGKSFSAAASRLSTPELDRLTAYCQSRLGALFPRLERLRFISSKTSHGDLDLLCAFDHDDIRIGGPQIGLSSETPSEQVRKNGQLHAFCGEVSQALQARGWIIAYFGYPIIALQVPCVAVDASHPDVQGFWQVDLALTTSASFEAYLFSCSYNIVFAILVLAAQTLSPALWLRRDSLNVRHRPYPSQPFVEVHLIGDRDELYRWFGLSMPAWHEGFASYGDIYKWFADVPPGSALSDAWDRIKEGRMDQAKLEYKRFYTREDGVPEFVTWLKADWASRSDSTSAAHGDTIPVDTAETSLSAASTSSVPPVSPPYPAYPTIAEIALDGFAQALVRTTGKADQFAELVAQRRTEVGRIAVAHERKRVNRARAAAEQGAAAHAGTVSPMRGREEERAERSQTGGDLTSEREQEGSDEVVVKRAEPAHLT